MKQEELKEPLVWHSRYSDTDEPDKQGRWARQLYYKGLLIGWVNRTEFAIGVVYTAKTFFPISGNDSPFGNSMFDTFKEAKEYIEYRWGLFRMTVA